MANVAVQLADGGGKEVKTDSTWGWVKSLEKGTSALAVNAEKIGSAVGSVGSVIKGLFGGSDSSEKTETAGSATSLLPLLALGGGLALLLK